MSTEKWEWHCDDRGLRRELRTTAGHLVLCPWGLGADDIGLTIADGKAGLIAAAPKLLAALKELLPALDDAWSRAIMDTPDAPIAAKLARIEEGSPETITARAAIALAEEDK